MKQITLRNKLNGEKFISDNFKQSEFIDGIEYIVVHKPDNERKFLMRKDSLEKDVPPKTSRVTSGHR